MTDTLLAIKVEGPGRPSIAAQHAYDTSVLARCDQALAAVQHWQPPAPQRGPQAAVAEQVRQQMWALKLAWLRAVMVARAYMDAALAPPGILFPAPLEVTKAASLERALEMRLRREWGVTSATQG